MLIHMHCFKPDFLVSVFSTAPEYSLLVVVAGGELTFYHLINQNLFLDPFLYGTQKKII